MDHGVIRRYGLRGSERGSENPLADCENGGSGIGSEDPGNLKVNS